MQLFIQGHSFYCVFQRLLQLVLGEVVLNGKSVWAVDEKQEIFLLWPIQYLCTYTRGMRCIVGRV